MKFSVRQICYIGIMAAITCALSIWQIPTPWGVPFTLQTFVVALCGYLLGRRDGTIAVIVYVLLGLVGLPVYAGMQSGPQVLAGYAGGFLYGFIFMALLCGFGGWLSKAKLGILWGILLGALGLAVCYLCGTLWFSHVMKMDFIKSLTLSCLPYLLKDSISLVGAFFISIILKRALVRAHIFNEDIKIERHD